MAATETATPFADVFAPASEEQWRQKVEAALKGAPFSRLISKTYDGFDIQPLYARASGKPRAFRGAGDWAVTARVDHPEGAEANKLALTDLENGANGLHVVFAGSAGAYGFGLKDAAALAPALEGVYLDAGLRIVFDLPGDNAAIVEAIENLVAGHDVKTLDLSLGLDPLGAAALSGEALDWPKAGLALAARVKALHDKGFGGVVAADGRIVHAAGGSPAQELAFALAAGVDYLRALEAGGLSLEDAREKIDFRLAADADEFLTLAKFRALRRLWASIETACGLASRPIRVHGETAWRMMTRRDPWVNLLRSTVAVFSAGLGGADSIAVLPFTQALGLPDALARRIARNTQLGPAGGIQPRQGRRPRRRLGRRRSAHRIRWSSAPTALFQDIEKAGGLAKALASGLIGGEIAKIASERAKAVARRKEPLTGASEFPDINEKPVAVLIPAPAAPAANAKALAPQRVAQPFEALRDKAEAAGARPKIFLANLGPIAAFTARATFAKNFFEAGGIEALSNDGFADTAALAAGFKASGAKLAVLCSSDALYAESGVAAAKALKDAGATVWFAGRPGDLEGALREAGVADFVFVGSDVLAQLTAALDAA